MKYKLLRFVFCVFLTVGPGWQAIAEDVGIQAPDGFKVSLYAGDSLAHDIHSMTIDSHGRVVVAGKGYVKILHDTDDDGRADKATMFSGVPKSGAHGMAFLGNNLVCTGDNSVMLLRDEDGDGKADGVPEVWANLKHPEHGANGVTIGPDGWIYVICGNDGGVSEKHATLPSSPVKKPQCGAVVRFSPDGKNSEIVAHGFRNPYDMAFNSYGHMFTVDADGERDQHLPWYTPTRLFDIAVGQHHGWVLEGWKRSWNRPEYFFDNVPRLVEIGRGSPTGVECYRHRQFPKHYRDGIFSCCWTLGRVYYFPLKPKGSSYESEKEIFLETTGDVGFAPVDLAVSPEGDLFVAIGGRGTRGSVFRVSYQPDGEKRDFKTEWDNDLKRVLNADQPFSSWSRGKWIPLAKKVGRDAFLAAALNRDRFPRQRIRAIEVLTEWFSGMPAEEESFGVGEKRVEARYLWAAARSPGMQDRQGVLRFASSYEEPIVNRAAWEGLARLRNLKGPRIVYGQLSWLSQDRRSRAACIHAANRLELDITAIESDVPRWRLARHWWKMKTVPLGDEAFKDAILAFELAARSPAKDRAEVQLEAVRTLQKCVGDIRVAPTQPEIHAGYLANDLEHISKALRWSAKAKLTSWFPTDCAKVNREIARVLGMLACENPHLLEKLVGCFTYRTRPEDAIHYLNVISLIPGERSERVTKRTAAALGLLHTSMVLDGKQPSRNWPLRVGELFTELAKRDPKLPAALVADTGYRFPAQAKFGLRMKGKDRLAAARKLLKVSEYLSEEEGEWTAEMVQLVAALPAEESLPALREQWHRFPLRDAIVEILTRAPQKEDRNRFLDSLDSTQSDVVALAAGALQKIGGRGEPEEIAAALRVLRRQCSHLKFAASRKALAELLQVWTGETIKVTEPERGDVLAAYQPWFDWFDKTHPELAANMRKFAGGADWKKRLTEIDWVSGDAGRGKIVFQRLACANCHGSNSRLGPELKGVAQRFSRNDLFAAIVDPNKDVSPLYYTTQLVTQSGKVYRGMMVYQSPDGTLLQTGPNTTIRITGDQIAETAKSRQSLMPTGLLDTAKDRELADLYAYLRTLR